MSTVYKKRVLAIDYGTKRVGVAISDPLCLFPSVTKTIPQNGQTLSILLDLIKKMNVGKIVLGYPDNYDDKPSVLGKEIIKFKIELQEKSGIEIHLWDENFTSKIAESRILNVVVKKSKRRDKSLIDAQSASIILEEYLKSIETN